MSLWLCASCYFLVSKYGSEFIYGQVPPLLNLSLVCSLY